MGIDIQYAVDPRVSGEVAFQGGKGIYEQEKDKFLLGESQFDQRLAQSESQFSRNLNYQQQLAMLKDRQLQEAQDIRSYERGQDRQAQGYDRQQDRQFRMAQMGMQEQSKLGAEDRAEKRGLSQELRLEQRNKQKQAYTQALGAAASIENAKLRPEQLQQAIDQWTEQYGSMPEFGGQFPFQSSMAANTNRPDFGKASADLAAKLGVEIGDPEIAHFLTEDEDGNAIPLYEDPIQQSEAIRDHVFKRQDGERRDEQLEQDAEKSGYDQQFRMQERKLKAEDDARKHELEMAKLKYAQEEKKQKAVDDKEKDAQQSKDKIKSDRDKHLLKYTTPDDEGKSPESSAIEAEMTRFDNARSGPMDVDDGSIDSAPVGRNVRVKLPDGKYIEGTIKMDPVKGKVLVTKSGQVFTIKD